MSRVAFLGIDGLDWRYIQEHLDVLPTFRGLAETAVLSPLPSIFPPDSIPAWTTIFTGESPEAHGVVESIDYLAKNPAKAAEGAPSFLRGRTFWDAVCRAGGRVCVINPFMAYPAWPVNGAMISGPVFVDTGRPSMYPTEAAAGLHLPQLGGVVDFPSDQTMPAFLERSLDVTAEQADFGLALLERADPDLFFMNILTIDRIQHFLWRYCDPTDPTYPGPNALEDGVRRAYRLTDDLVGRFAAALEDDDVLLVASDHGHGRRPSLMFFVDELLRRERLFDTGGVRQTIRTFALEKTKRGALRTAYALRRESEVYALARRIPGRKALKTSTYADSGGSLAATSRAFGRSSAGGIDINGSVSGESRRGLANHICAILLAVRDLQGEPVCDWARPREELLSGPAADRFPDVLFQLREDVAVDFGVFTDLFGEDPLHRRVSGGHRRYGIFASSTVGLPLIPTRLDQLHATVVRSVVGVRA